MTLFLTILFLVAMGLAVATSGLLLAPNTHAELKVWRRLRVSSLRRWLTRRRHVEEPLDRVHTARVARRNLIWHLVMTGLFSGQLCAAIAFDGTWWRPWACVLIVPCIAYFAGSLVQRQKMAVIHSLLSRRHRFHLHAPLAD